MAIGLNKTRDALTFEFPEVHADARMTVTFHRTLRIPDDGHTHRLPPSLGAFPLRDVDELDQAKVPEAWRKRAGVVFPMWQSEAMWMRFSADGYPFVVKIAAGKINAVDGKPWDETFRDDGETFGRSAEGQNYVAVPRQPWIDGFCVEKGKIRQFVAMPLGRGYTVEEQVTGKAEFGGLQFLVAPLKREKWEMIRHTRQRSRSPFGDMNMWAGGDDILCMSMSTGILRSSSTKLFGKSACADMGLAQGGTMAQAIYENEFALSDFDFTAQKKVFVSIVDSLTWRALTGSAPPTVPPTARDYTAQGLPWFDYYADAPAVDGSSTLAGVKTVKNMAETKGEAVLPENDGIDPAKQKVVKLSQAKMASGAPVLRAGVF